MKSQHRHIFHDYKKQQFSNPPVRRLRWFAIGLGLPLLGLLLIVNLGSQQEDSTTTAGLPATAPVGLPPGPPPSDALREARIDLGEALVLVVRRGDSLDRLFRKHRLSVSDLGNMLRVSPAKQSLRMLRPGDEIRIWHQQGQVQRLERDLDQQQTLALDRSDDGFTAELVQHAIERRMVSAHAKISNSLFEAGRTAEISDKLTMEMAGIFQWDIDFVQDVREDDEFTLLYEEIWRDGSYVRDGDIVAAEFINRSTPYRAVQYVDGEGGINYYTPQGRNVRKAFIRAPVDFSRISSSFNMRRKHPILNKIRAHRGVDYAAPAGTPIKAAGDGKVMFRGAKGGYGNVIILQHGGNISTLYAHMSKFVRSTRVGSQVEQSDTIGFVGQTGLATASHLHYEYRLNGVHRNPRTVKLPDAEPIPAQYREDFMLTAEPLIAQLDLYRRTQVALRGANP